MFRNSLSNEKYFFRLSYLIVIISFLLDLYYRFFIVPQDLHYGYILQVSVLKYVIAKVLLVGLLTIGYFIFNRSLLLYTIFLLLVFFFYIPNSILFSLADGSYKPFFSNFIFCALFYLSTKINFKIPSIKITPAITDWLLIGLTVVVLLPIVYTFRSHIALNTLLLKDIYKTRAEFSLHMSGWLNYCYHLAVKTIIPVSMIYFLIRGKKLFFFLHFFALIYLYVISGNKIVYFYSCVIILFYFVSKENVKKLNYFLIFFVLALLVLPVLDYSLMDKQNPVWSGTFVNRFLFIPSRLTQWYFEFFDGKPFYFAESHLFNHFVKSPYDLPVGFLISKVYLHTTDTYANNGVVSDGFMNLGYSGVIIFSLIVAALFGTIKSLKLHAGYFGIYFGFIYTLLSAPMLSCFLTGGIAIFLVLAVFLLRSDSELSLS